VKDTEKKDVEEMARDICHMPRKCETCDIARISDGKCQARTYAERAYAKGWRRRADNEQRKAD